MLSSRIYPRMPQFNTEFAIRAIADTLQENLRGKDLLSCSAEISRFGPIFQSPVLVNFTFSREVSFCGKRMLLAATFPDSTQSIR
jgi:hypothetical protein